MAKFDKLARWAGRRVRSVPRQPTSQPATPPQPPVSRPPQGGQFVYAPAPAPVAPPVLPVVPASIPIIAAYAATPETCTIVKNTDRDFYAEFLAQLPEAAVSDSTGQPLRTDLVGDANAMNMPGAPRRVHPHPSTQQRIDFGQHAQTRYGGYQQGTQVQASTVPTGKG